MTDDCKREIKAQLDTIAIAVERFIANSKTLAESEYERLIRDRLTLAGSGFRNLDFQRIAHFWRLLEPIYKESQIPVREKDAIYGLISYTADILFAQGAVGYEDRDYIVTPVENGFWLDFLYVENPRLVEKRVKIESSIDGVEILHDPDLANYRSPIIEEIVAGWPESRRLPFARLVNDLVWKGAPWVKVGDLAPGGEIYGLIVGKAKSEFEKRKRSRIDTFQNKCDMEPTSFLALDDKDRINALEKRSQTPEEKDKAALRALKLIVEARKIETMCISEGDLKAALRERIIERLGRKHE